MVQTLSKIGEGAFADVYGCQGDDWRKLALKVGSHSLIDYCFSNDVMVGVAHPDPASGRRHEVQRRGTELAQIHPARNGRDPVSR